MLQSYLWVSSQPTKAATRNIRLSPQLIITDTNAPVLLNLSGIRMLWCSHNINTLHKHPTTQLDLLLQVPFLAVQGSVSETPGS